MSLLPRATHSQPSPTPWRNPKETGPSSGHLSLVTWDIAWDSGRPPGSPGST